VKCGLPSDAVAFGLPFNGLVAAERSEAELECIVDNTLETIEERP
jgi:hypothetical protein